MAFNKVSAGQSVAVLCDKAVIRTLTENYKDRDGKSRIRKYLDNKCKCSLHGDCYWRNNSRTTQRSCPDFTRLEDGHYSLIENPRRKRTEYKWLRD